MTKSIVANLEPSDVVALTSECLRLLLESDLSLEDMLKVINDETFRRELIHFWRGKNEKIEIEEPESHQRARKIMGQNFLGFSEVATEFGITNEQIKALGEIPFSEEVLRECAQTHVLVAYTGLSIIEIRKKMKQGYFYKDDISWFNCRDFASEQGEISWLLIQKKPVEGSTQKYWKDKVTLINDETEEVPKANQLTFAIMLLYKTTDERMFEDTYVCTSSRKTSYDHISLGEFDSNGLTFDEEHDHNRDEYTGLSSAKKIPT